MARYVTALVLLSGAAVQGFEAHRPTTRWATQPRSLGVVAMAEDAVAEEPVAEPMALPTAEELKSETGFDFMPLAEKLAAREWEEADQITRDALIAITSEEAVKRKFVYWTEVKTISKVDLATMERLWLKYSDGKFGYSVQRRIWKLQKEDFENFCNKISWNVEEDGVMRKRRWFGTSEFIYDLETAPKGHLPLTSALRGTSLIKEIFTHPLWEEDEWNPKKK